MREVAKKRREEVLKMIKKQFRKNKEGVVSPDLLSEVKDLDFYLKEARQGILSFKHGELAVEVPVQLCLLVTMLLLAFSTTFTNSGLQTFVKLRPEDLWTEMLFFYGSIMWSFKTCFSTYMKVKEEKKSHMLSLAGKIFLGTRGLLVICYLLPFLLCSLSWAP